MLIMDKREVSPVQDEDLLTHSSMTCGYDAPLGEEATGCITEHPIIKKGEAMPGIIQLATKGEGRQGTRASTSALKLPITPITVGSLFCHWYVSVIKIFVYM